MNPEGARNMHGPWPHRPLGTSIVDSDKADNSDVQTGPTTNKQHPNTVLHTSFIHFYFLKFKLQEVRNYIGVLVGL